jgi:hypothetical protein
MISLRFVNVFFFYLAFFVYFSKLRGSSVTSSWLFPQLEEGIVFILAIAGAGASGRGGGGGGGGGGGRCYGMDRFGMKEVHFLDTNKKLVPSK